MTIKMEKFWIHISMLITLFQLNGKVHVNCDEYLPTSHFLNPMGHGHDGPQTCEPIKIGLCMGVGYNETVMPNQNVIGHEGQTDAEAVLQTFAPLIQYGCSAHLKLLLCSAFVPMCTNKVPTPIGPCRDLCLSVKSKCEPIMVEFGFSWPPSLDCNLFHPENNHQNMCIPGIDSPPSSSSSSSSSGTGTMGGSMSHGHSTSGWNPNSNSNANLNSRQKSTDNKGLNIGGGMEKNSIGDASLGGGFGTGSGGGFFSSGGSPGSILDHPHHSLNPIIPDINFHGGDEDGLHHPPLTIHRNINDGNNGIGIGIGSGSGLDLLGHGQGPPSMSEINCGLKVVRKGECYIPCSGRGKVTTTTAMTMSTAVLHHGIGAGGFPTHGGFFLQHEQEFGRRYAFIWAVLSLTGAVIAVILATTLARSLSSPAERPVVYIALCQIFYSIGVIIGSTNVGNGPCVFDKVTGMDLMARGSLVPPSCSLVFLLTYFFGIASTLWWVMLCLSWLLSLNKSFANSLETREWSMYHLFTWAAAFILTCTVLLRKNVDSDELTGVCGVGFQEDSPFLYFMVIPLAACLGNGLALLLTGFLLRYRTRYRKKARYGRRNGGIVGDYEVVSSSLGPSFTNLQQKRLSEKSKTTWNRVLIFALVHLIPVFTHVGTLFYEFQSRPSWRNQEARPNLQLFLLKINMNLIPGLTTGVWILSIYSWKSWLLKIFSCTFPSRLDCNKLIQQTVINFSSGSSSSAHSNNRHQSSSSHHHHHHSSGIGIPSLSITDPTTAALNPFHNNGHHHSGTSTFHPGARTRELPPIPNPNLNPNNNNNNSSSVNQTSHHTHTHHTHSHGDQLQQQQQHSHGLRTETWRRGETIV